MNLSVIDLPPGVSRKGTRDQEKGRWRDSDLVRFSEGNVGPVGGWTARTTSAMTGKARAMLLSRSYATGGPRTIVIVTHNMQQAARCSDYTAYMYLGELVEFGATEELFFKPQRRETEDYITGRFG